MEGERERERGERKGDENKRRQEGRGGCFWEREEEKKKIIGKREREGTRKGGEMRGRERKRRREGEREDSKEIKRGNEGKLFWERKRKRK